MGRVLKLISVFCLVFLMAQASFAQEHKLLVLPDNVQFDSTNYYVFPDTSTIFASDTINELKKSGRVEIVSMTEVRDALRKNTKLNILTKKALKEFKYNYNIPFVDFQAIAHKFSTDKVLVITSQTDTQNYLLRRTFWDWINLPGGTVIDPVYKMATYAALIDVDKEEVIWQSTFYKNIGSMESRMIAGSFAPATEQLQKIRFYSEYCFSPQVAKIVLAKVAPPEVAPAKQTNVDVSNKERENYQPEVQNIELKPKYMPPTRPDSDSWGEMINDI